MEEEKEEKKIIQKNMRCTQFEYSSSGSDSEEENSKYKNKFHKKFLSKKKI